MTNIVKNLLFCRDSFHHITISTQIAQPRRFKKRVEITMCRTLNPFIHCRREVNGLTFYTLETIEMRIEIYYRMVDVIFDKSPFLDQKFIVCLLVDSDSYILLRLYTRQPDLLGFPRHPLTIYGCFVCLRESLTDHLFIFTETKCDKPLI